MLNESSSGRILGACMHYRKILAERVFDGNHFLPIGSVVVVNREGVIEDIINTDLAGDHIETYEGILTPGLINAHCHLELSYLKGKIPERTGLVNFLMSVVELRKKQTNIEEILSAIESAEAEMWQNGIVGVGDISNTDHTIKAKLDSNIDWYTFIEVLNFFDGSLAERLAHNQKVLEAFTSAKLEAVLTPHAPYTVSKKTFESINAQTARKLISIHNQETASENALFKTGEGEFLKLYEAVGFEKNPFEVSGLNSLQTYVPHFNGDQKILLVHNTFISEDDLVFLEDYTKKTGIHFVFCLCPNANLYIEQALPPIDLFIKHNCPIVLGTDSYSSNWHLSIAQEVYTIIQHFPHIPLETVLQWATCNGSKCFGWSHLGMLKKGAKPGLTLLETNNSSLTGVSKRIL